MLWRFRKQPARGIYLTIQILLMLCVRIPTWCFLELTGLRRKRANWSLYKALWIRFMRKIMEITYTTGQLRPVPDFTRISAGPSVKAEWIPPAQDILFGEIKAAAEKNNVKGIRIPGYWYYKPGIEEGSLPSRGQKVALCIHGGSYILMSAYPADYPANIARGILEHCPTIFRAFMVEYRLTSSHPYPNNGAFPSALIDSLSGYIHLITLGYNPKDIVLVGDSAGGNIALGLVRYLLESAVESCGKLPPSPGALILLSPWADIGPSHRSQGTHVSNRNTDYILATEESHAYIKAGLCSSLGTDIVNRSKYFSPASRYINAINFEGFPRTFLSAGGAEMLLDQLETLKRRMEMDIGTSKESGLQYHFKPDAVHDWLLFPWHEPERTETLKAIGAWMS